MFEQIFKKLDDLEVLEQKLVLENAQLQALFNSLPEHQQHDLLAWIRDSWTDEAHLNRSDLFAVLCIRWILEQTPRYLN